MQTVAGIGGVSVVGSVRGQSAKDTGKGLLGSLVLAGIGEALVQSERLSKRKRKKKRRKKRKGTL